MTNCDPPDPIRLGVGIVAVVLVLLLIERLAPEYSTLYIIIVLLGMILTNANCFKAFMEGLAGIGGGTQ